MKAAENDDETGMYNVGLCYSEGDGVEKDKEKAFEWYLKAADKNHAQGAYKVGYCYQHGTGVAKDLDKAESFYSKAKELGCDKGKRFLKKRYKEYHFDDDDVYCSNPLYETGGSWGRKRLFSVDDAFI